MEARSFSPNVRVSNAPAIAENDQKSLSVLVVEDETVLRQVIARNLSAHGHEVLQAATAEETIEKISICRPDLLLLDINLPDHSGWDVMRALKSMEIEVPTVVVSAVRVSPARLAEFGPLAYLPKPFPLDSLMRIVEDISKRDGPASRSGFAGSQDRKRGRENG